MLLKYKVCWTSWLIVTILACQQESIDIDRHFIDNFKSPESFGTMNIPTGNELTYDRWLLGKKLFYDKRLSHDGHVSCASCHDPSLAFADDQAISPGVNGRLGKRNAPSLANIGYHPYFTREGGLATLDMQVLVPIQEHEELSTLVVDILARIGNDDEYKSLAQKAYQRDLDGFVLTRAITNFERSIISSNNRLDQYEQGNKKALSSLELQGKDIFYSEKAQCSSCHEGSLMTNFGIVNNGIYTQYLDPGLMRLTRKMEDEGKFKIPSLRNIAVTAPYMHDGSIKTLDQVVEHYNSGGQNHPNKDARIKNLNLTDEEKLSLVAFLKALTDHDFLKNTVYR